MPKTSEERYMEWLVREEEEKGVGWAQRHTMDYELARDKLREELPYEPHESQIEAIMKWGRARYEILPEVGIITFKAPHFAGWHMGYYDVTTKRITSYVVVHDKLEAYWKEWGY